MEVVAYNRGGALLNQERKVLELVFKELLKALAW